MSANDLGRRFLSFYDVVTRLASEEGCPWDREQTVLTLTENFKEECGELEEAARSENTNGVIEELGDVLYLVCLSAAAAQRRGSFDMNEVLQTVRRKAVFRHPDVFGSGEAGELEGESLTRDGRASRAFVARKSKEQPRFCWGRNYYAP